MQELEQRTIENGLELRAMVPGEASSNPLGRIVGYFGKYNQLSEPILAPNRRAFFKEEMTDGAFRSAAKSDRNIAALYHHDIKDLLGCTAAGTFQLRDDGIGLWGEIDPPDTSTARDVVANMRAGNIRGASMGFFDVRGAVKWRQENGWDIRSVSDIQMREGTVTGFPIYRSTALNVRSLLVDFAGDEHEALICRALNRVENNLDVIDEDRDILREYRSKLNELLPPEKRALMDSLLGPATEQIVISPVGLIEWAADALLISVDGAV